jgi:sortase A
VVTADRAREGRATAGGATPGGTVAAVLAKWVGRLGKALCATGVLVFLFVLYQLWGTGIRTSLAQSDLEQQFAQIKREAAPAHPPPPSSGSSSTTSTSSSSSTTSTGPAAATHPGSTTATLPSDVAPVGSTPASRQPVGRIEIPKIGTSYIVVEGTDVDALRLGPGHFTETPLPGQPGNAAIAGHRTTFGAPFNRIDELVPGDPIEVETTQGHFTYRVEDTEGTGLGHHIVDPSQTEILDQHGEDNTLTLMACNPKGYATQRIVVVGKLVDLPAPVAPVPTTTPKRDPVTGQVAPPSAGAPPLLASDSSFLPTIIWGLVAADIWLAAWLVARRWRGRRTWRPWATYGAALPLFLVALYFTFEGINALLPAGY